MGLLDLYDPPAHMNDIDAIRGQRMKWHEYVVEQFDVQIKGLHKSLSEVSKGRPYQPQFFNATSLNPGAAAVEQAVVWNAFPKELLRRFGRKRALIEADRIWPVSAYRHDWIYDSDSPPGQPFTSEFPESLSYRPTVEYCEWHVDRDLSTGRISRVVFTSEPPEYWLALAGGRLDGSEVVFPGDKNLLLDLYRRYVNPAVQLDDLLTRATYKSPFGTHERGEYDPYNKWNTTHGAMHLCAPPNSLVAEINLAAVSTLLYEDKHGVLLTDADALIVAAALGGPNRNSDPTIAGTVNVLARGGAMVTLANPVGLYMDHIDLAGWVAPGGVSASDCVRILRGEPNAIERLEIRYPTSEHCVSDILIGGEPIRYGGQIAECITVKLVGVAVMTGIDNPRIMAPEVGYLDPADARQVFGRKGGPRAGLVPAFSGESGESSALPLQGKGLRL